MVVIDDCVLVVIVMDFAGPYAYKDMAAHIALTLFAGAISLTHMASRFLLPKASRWVDGGTS